ncbi:MucBP domain-containing protein [Lentilactobacillus sunkii]|uniref:MucBP domain-containing protein n=1 Tax=Lentilactobacillus sunkii TaxID=481719 RepID=UPI001F1B47B4|nr:MucBP domain-containing protein [Lentilactobacillus sunkii]
MKIANYLGIVIFGLGSAFGLMLMDQHTDSFYSPQTVQAADGQNNVAADADGTIITPTKIVKAPDPADKTNNPTIDPKQHTDAADTNFYQGSRFHQAPVYIDGKLANPMGKNAVVGGQTISDVQGTINENDYIDPPIENEVINYGYYSGSNAWMIGWTEDNKTAYIHKVNEAGTLLETIKVPAPGSPDFNANWTTGGDGLTFSWLGDKIHISFDRGSLRSSSTAGSLEFLTGIPVKFVDARGNELAPTQTVSGHSGTFVNVDYPTISGYRLVRVPYMNNAHKFLINNTTATKPSTDWFSSQINQYVTLYQKIIDDNNTRQMYMVFDYSKVTGAGFSGTETSKTVTVKATQGGAIAAAFSNGIVRATSTASMPTPVGNPLTFVYEPITEYHLTINYLEKGTDKVMADPYKASGAGTYEIESPVISGYTADKATVKGVLGSDSTINVYYDKKDVPPVEDTSLNIKYIDEESNKPLKTETLKGKVGDDYHADGQYQLETITVDGTTYELNKTNLPTNATGKFAKTNADVNYYYKKKAAPVEQSSLLINYINEDGNKILKTDSLDGKVGNPYEVDSKYQLETLTIDGVTYKLNKGRLPSNTKGTFATKNDPVNYYYTKQNDPVDTNSSLIINYINEENNGLLKVQTIQGKVGDPYQADGQYQLQNITVNGVTYVLNTTRLPGNMRGTFSSQNAPVNYYYKKKTNPVDPIIPVIPIIPVTPVTPVTPVAPVTPVTPTPDGTDVLPGKIAKKGMAVYALKKVYLYQNPTFKKLERKSGYVKKPRVFRPMFVVTDYARSNEGRLRYKVRDVNHLSKTDGWTGYVTTNYEYIRPVYYQSKHSTLTVINPRGVNEYTRVNLTGKVKNFKQGTILKVKGFVTHNLTTRYLLSNGNYITGNRKLVKMGKHKQPKQLVVKKSINRYKTANLTQRNGHFKKGQKLTIKRYTFSHEGSITKSGTKRYVVKGGYITANNKFVKVVKY